jgi:hypothetical protein
MAITANICRDLEGGAAGECHYFVLRMTIRAGRSIPVTCRDRFAVNAFGHIFGCLIVTSTTGLSQTGKMERGIR